MPSASYAADPGSTKKMERSIFGYGCVGYENDCGKIEWIDGHKSKTNDAVTAQ